MDVIVANKNGKEVRTLTFSEYVLKLDWKKIAFR